MRTLRGTYVHRGDAIRRRRQIRRLATASGAVAFTVLTLAVHRTTSARAEFVASAELFGRESLSLSGARGLREQLRFADAELNAMRADMARARKISEFSTTYAIATDLAANIFDASLHEGIDPDLTFRLVRLESDFHVDAVSKVGAVGLAQLMLSTARQYEQTVSAEQLLDARTNLRVGLRYLRTLLDQYKGDVRLALLAYNRGEDAVWRDLKAGVDPGNGYDRFVLRDYKGTGFVR